MEWSAQQQEALRAVERWYRGDSQFFYLAGYAGTGKTTLARAFADQIGGTVYYGAFTGKAAHVMASKGCHGATTIHKLIYQPKDRSKFRLEELQSKLDDLIQQLVAEEHESPESHPSVRALRVQIAKENENGKRPNFVLNPISPVGSADLTIIDECSMIDKQIGQDLLSFGTKVLVLGDPAQLPPVKGTGYFTSREPDFLLTEIHRQARDNPIIRLATDIREGRQLELGVYGESRVIDWADVEPEYALEADQVLVGTNRLRRATNGRMRELLGRTSSPYPLPGDKLVCLRNDHEHGFLNGSMWVTETCRSLDDDARLMIEVAPDTGSTKILCEAHAGPFDGRETPWFELREAQLFEYGYAMTTHKAQGSQWGNVLLFDQSKVFKSDASKWLYTAVTRAAEKITIVVP